MPAHTDQINGHLPTGLPYPTINDLIDPRGDLTRLAFAIAENILYRRFESESQMQAIWPDAPVGSVGTTAVGVDPVYPTLQIGSRLFVKINDDQNPNTDPKWTQVFAVSETGDFMSFFDARLTMTSGGLRSGAGRRLQVDEIYVPKGVLYLGTGAKSTWNESVKAGTDGLLFTDTVASRQGDYLFLCAGESNNHIPRNGTFDGGGYGEAVIMAAEHGLKVYASVNNWGSGWAGRKRVLVADSANFNVSVRNASALNVSSEYGTAGYISFRNGGTADNALGATRRGYVGYTSSSMRLKNDVTADTYIGNERGGKHAWTRIHMDTSNRSRVNHAGDYKAKSSSAANVVISSSGWLYHRTSSARFKKDIESMADEHADVIHDLRPVKYKAKVREEEKGTQPEPEDWSFYGFIAEEVADIDPRLVHWEPSPACDCSPELVVPIMMTDPDDETGDREIPSGQFDDNRHLHHHSEECLIPSSVQYDVLTAHLTSIVQRQAKVIEEQDARLAALEAAVAQIQENCCP